MYHNRTKILNLKKKIEESYVQLNLFIETKIIHSANFSNRVDQTLTTKKKWYFLKQVLKEELKFPPSQISLLTA